MVKPTKSRSMLKAFGWQTSGVLIVWLVTSSLKTGLLYFLARMVMYFLYERGWSAIKWGNQDA